jgi:DNA repair exonuclease SbcCD nuclease subunit
MTITLGHLSDTHIGYESYKALSVNGENQRSVDFAKAFTTVCDEIISANPMLVIHSGDVADRTVIPIRLMLLIRRQIERLASIRPDGTRRQVVIVAGNHELPRNRREACFLELLRGLPGVHLATTKYEQITFDGSGVSMGCDPALHNAVVHALPHDVLKTVDFDQVRPVPGKSNIISSHGVAGGSELYVRSLGREFAIPTDVLAREWEYGALGHWHKQGPIPLVSTGGVGRLKSAAQSNGVVEPDEESDRGRIWYAGSTENCGFGDLRENGQRRGWLHVTINRGEEPAVRRRNLPIRSMFRLTNLDATGMTPEQITEALILPLRSAPITGAVVGQIVEGVGRDIWSLVDLRRVRDAAATALHYDVTLKPLAQKEESGSRSNEHRGLAEASDVMLERAIELIADAEQRQRAVTLASELLTVQLEKADRERDQAKVSGANADNRERDGEVETIPNTEIEV